MTGRISCIEHQERSSIASLELDPFRAAELSELKAEFQMSCPRVQASFFFSFSPKSLLGLFVNLTNVRAKLIDKVGTRTSSHPASRKF